MTMHSNADRPGRRRARNTSPGDEIGSGLDQVLVIGGSPETERLALVSPRARHSLYPQPSYPDLRCVSHVSTTKQILIRSGIGIPAASTVVYLVARAVRIPLELTEVFSDHFGRIPVQSFVLATLLDGGATGTILALACRRWATSSRTNVRGMFPPESTAGVGR
jgi:hypothetical protein